jgi:hypothetical protein
VAGRLFFPHRQALGLKVDEDLSPALVERLTYLGAKLPSFRDAHEALDVLLRTKLSEKRVERQTERIGDERVAQRQAAVEAWSERTLLEKKQAPAGVKAPSVAAVLGDGGRLQLREANAEKTSRWHEYKAGVLQGLDSQAHAVDPCPEIPALYLQQDRIDKLSRQITQVAAKTAANEPKTPAVTAATDEAAPVIPPEDIQPHGYDPPKVVDRDVTATRANSRQFGRQLAEKAWWLGLFGAERKAFVGDGQNWIWTEWERHFKAFGFVPILDFIHALTHVYAAAMAGQDRAQGWQVYQRWITWIWQGRVTEVIVELAERQRKLGPPSPDDGETSPRTLVTDTLTYLQNQQSRMNYPEYRRQGLPITSAHMESAVKLINRRVKGSEKYWTERGAEALLQLTADLLSTSQPLTEFWRTRPHRQTGCRTYSRSAI